MTTIIVRSARDRVPLNEELLRHEPPFTVTVTHGKKRSIEQNRLQRKWMNEISEHLGDMSPEYARGYCKLTLGVPILRADNEAFRQQYDRIVKPLTYEQKIALMQEPLDLPITRLMTVKQKSRYLEDVLRHFASQGVKMTIPDDMLAEKCGIEPVQQQESRS